MTITHKHPDYPGWEMHEFDLMSLQIDLDPAPITYKGVVVAMRHEPNVMLRLPERVIPLATDPAAIASIEAFVDAMKAKKEADRAAWFANAEKAGERKAASARKYANEILGGY